MMQSTLSRFVTVVCLLVFLTPNIALSAQERRIVLIIGNGAYKSSYLKNPANDANDIAEALKESQFTITKLINADRRKMESAIRHFGNSLKREDVGLFYFAGHGVQVNGRNYLIPIGSPEVPKPNFIKLDDDVVYDKNTGLEWYAGPDKGTSWNDANKWVENLTVAGGGWRLPTRQELKTLYNKGVGTHNMTPLLKTTGWFVWSSETKGSLNAWGFSFSFGFDHGLTRGSPIYFGRGFAVRSRK
jgi:hypothetical protein